APVPGPVGLGGFEDDGPRPVPGEAPVDAHGGEVVGKDPADDGDDPPLAGEVGEFRGGGPRGAPVESRHDVTGNWRPSKQERVPRWQAASTCSTRTSTASPSQSRATDFTYCTCPEVSPLRQYSPRERDQNVTRPSVRVRWRASSSKIGRASCRGRVETG